MSETANPKNRLLAALPREEYARLLPKLEETPLIFGKIIYETDDIIHSVYFPESGIVSLLSTMEKRSPLEVGIVGNEGLVGLPAFLGVKTSNNRALVQGAGVAMRLKTADFLTEAEKGGALSRLVKRYTHSLMVQISQAAVCNNIHRIETRLARWLLMSGDRMESDDFQITQEFLSHMLGVRREAVSKAATRLQRNGLISYSYGKISILDRDGPETAACRCYFITKEENKNFLTDGIKL